MSYIESNSTNLEPFLIKFGRKENLLKLQHGKIYMKNIKYYNMLEENQGIIGIGDKYDSKAILNKIKVTLLSYENKSKFLEFDADKAVFDMHYQNSPVFCTFILDNRNCIYKEIVNNKLNVHFIFSDEQRAKIETELGDYALLIDKQEFINRIKECFIKENISCHFGTVNYIDFSINYVQHFKEFIKKPYNIAFWKDFKKFAYQQEFRLFLFEKKVDDFFEIDIGDIRDFSYLYRTNELVNSELIIEEVK